MKTHRFPALALLAALPWLAPWPAQAAPLTSAFTYQGRLTAGGAPAQGLYDLRLRLFDAEAGGIQIGPTLTNSNVGVTNGLFTTSLDFGSGIFNGTTYWMEVALRPGGMMINFSPLLPRQPITAAPYALFAPNAGNAGNAPWSGLTGLPAGFADNVDNDTLYSAGSGLSLVATQFSVNFAGSGSAPTAARSDHAHAAQDVTSGTLADERLSANIARLNANQTFTGLVTLSSSTDEPFAVGNANKITDLHADWLDGLDATDFWQLGGNAGTTPGAQFIGTTDPQPLELKVNGARALRLEPRAASPALLGGFGGNRIAVTAEGATIVGGGSAGLTNVVSDSYSSIGGGRDNAVNAALATLGGGEGNQILTGATGATLGGGQLNTIHTNAARAVLGGGNGNSIQQDAAAATLAGGARNSIQPRANHAFIGGGSNQVIQSDASFAVIAGGSLNALRPGTTNATIGGGRSNVVQTNAAFATISGGQNNTVATNALYATIPGGLQARAAHYGQMAFASGRFANDGDAQSSLFVLRGTTLSPVVSTNLFLDGLSKSMIVPDNTSWVFDILIVGRMATGVSAGYHLRGLVENNSGTTALVGVLDKSVLAEDDPSWDATVEVASGAFQIRVTGPTAPFTVQWVAKLRTVEVTF